MAFLDFLVLPLVEFPGMYSQLSVRRNWIRIRPILTNPHGLRTIKVGEGGGGVLAQDCYYLNLELNTNSCLGSYLVL